MSFSLQRRRTRRLLSQEDLDVDFSNLQTCKHSACSPNVHQHPTKSCQGHSFCDAGNIQQWKENTTDRPIPFPFSGNLNEKYLTERFQGKLRDGPLPKHQKLVVTEYGLDHWLALQYNLNIENLPQARPPNVPRTVFDQLRKYQQANAQNSIEQPKKNSFNTTRRKQKSLSFQLGRTPMTRNNLNSSKQSQKISLARKTAKASSKYINNTNNLQHILYPASQQVQSVIDGLIEEEKQVSEVVSQENLLLNKDKKNNSFQKNSPVKKSMKDQMQSDVRNKVTEKMNSILRGNVLSNRTVRNRLISPQIDFLSKMEIEKAAQSYQTYNLLQTKKTSVDYQSQYKQDTTQSNDYESNIAKPSKPFSKLLQRKSIGSSQTRRTNKSFNYQDQLNMTQQVKNAVPQSATRNLNLNTSFTPHTLTKAMQSTTNFGSKGQDKRFTFTRRSDYKRVIAFETPMNESSDKLKFILHQSYGVTFKNLQTQESQEVSPKSQVSKQKEEIESKPQEYPKTNMNNQAFYDKVANKKVELSIEEEEQKRIQKLVKNIFRDLNSELSEEKYESQEDFQLNVTEYQLNYVKLETVIKDMNDPLFWLQKAQKCLQSDKIEAAMDYYKQGLRYCPTNEHLLYNIGCAFEKLGKYNNTIRWFTYIVELNPRFTDALFGIALTYLKKDSFKEAQDYIEQAISSYRDALTPLNNMIYVRAMIYKKNGEFVKAQRDYKSLSFVFKQKEHREMIQSLFGLILLPLCQDRKITNNYITNVHELIQFYDRSGDSSRPLKQFQNSTNNKLDLQKYKHNVLFYLVQKSFFKRFTRDQIESQLKDAEIEYYENEDIVFLNDRVGVVLKGSIILKSHQNDCMKPKAQQKFIEGSIVGFDLSDSKKTNLCMNWLIANDSTEVIYFSKQQFQQLWNYQYQNLDKKVLITMLQSNMFFKNLRMQLQHRLVFEYLEIRKYRPNQLIAKQAQRSALNSDYLPFFQDRVTKFRQDIENKIVEKDGNLTIFNSQVGSLMSAIKENSMMLRSQGQSKRESLQSSPAEKMIQNKPVRMSLPQSSNYSSNPSLNMKTDFKGEEIVEYQNSNRNIRFIVEDVEVGECDGVYIIDTGSVNLKLGTQVNHILFKGDNFGESNLVKKAGFEYLGDIYSGDRGVSCFFFPYTILKLIAPEEITNIRSDSFQKIKEGLFHVIAEKYRIDPDELNRF